MKLILNIVAKDARRLRWGVGFLLLTTTAKFALGWWLVLGAVLEPEVWKELPKFVTGLVALEALLTWLLTGMLVIEDPLTGTTAAWRTRPIAGGRLLAAKIVAAFLLLVAPALVLGLPWWGFNGFGWAQVWPAVLTSVIMQVAVIVPSLFVAVWVDSIARFVVWSLAGVAALLTMPLVWAIGTAKVLPGFQELGILLTDAACGIAMLGLVAWRYRCGLRRRTLASLTLAGTGLVAASGLLLVWRDRPQQSADWTARNAERVEGLRLEWRSASVVDFKRSSPPYAQVYSRVEAVGLRDDWFIDGVMVWHTWSWPDGARSKSRDWGMSGMRLAPRMLGVTPEKPDEETQRWHQRRKAERAAKFSLETNNWMERTARRSASELVLGASVTPSVAARLRKAPSDYELSAQLRVMQARTLFELPLTAGASTAGEGYRIRVLRVKSVGQHREVRAVESRPAWAGLTFGETNSWLRGLRQPSVYSVDREGGRVSPLWGETSASVMIGSVELLERRTTFYAPVVIRDDRWTLLDTAWDQRVRLTLVGWDEVARVTREVRTRFKIDAVQD